MRRAGYSSIVSATYLLQALRHQTVPPRRLLHVNDSLLSGTSADAMEVMYVNWKKNPESVDPSFQEFFSTMNAKDGDYDTPVLDHPIRVVSSVGGSAQSLQESGRLSWMVQCFEHRGHLVASIDPLNYKDDPNQRIPSRKVSEALCLDVEFFGFQPHDLDKVYTTGFHSSVGGLLHSDTPPMTLRALHERLVRTYCGNIGWDYSHVDDVKVARWLREQIETPERVSNAPLSELDKNGKLKVLKDLAYGVKFEQFMNKKFYMQKRFGLDGGESLIAGLQALLERTSDHGVEEVVVGMAHRGRLSSLYNITGKPFPALVKEFSGLKPTDYEGIEGQGDVKYHLGWRGQRKLSNGKEVLVEMMCNPSHLECVNPIVQGRTRASQFHRGEAGQKKVLPIEIHGDAAFAGQGVAFETMGLSELTSYHTGGTIHVVVNNQIGFTTDPKSSRSSAHCTDLGRVFHCPVFHVNGDKPEEVVKVFKMAADYRAQFGRSVVIDLVCYRRFGHNETDDPTVTQPLMYSRITKRADIFTLYSQELINSKAVSADEVKAVETAVWDEYNREFDKAATYNYPPTLKTKPPQWAELRPEGVAPKIESTKVSAEFIKPIVDAVGKLPEGFKLHKILDGILGRRHKSLQGLEGMDWGGAEILALGTLLLEGFHVRISGQDVQRATFSQRHAVVHDQVTDATYCHLANISPNQGKIVVQNSSLSEFGVLGFETGYSLYHPKQFVMWEAQFGDFANGAQIIFDNFLSSGESKWNLQYAPVISMPHGYDGNGPEHSSGRIERFLQMVNEDENTIIRDVTERMYKCNMEVTFPTTPAQYFHLIRRHVHRNFRKPWVNFFSKAFLRAPNLSTLEECLNGELLPVIGDTTVDPANATVVLLCSGQIYFYLAEERQRLGRNDIAIIRVEQLAPFPSIEIEAELAKYSKTAPIRWVQEEPKNNGAWTFVEPRLHHLLQNSNDLREVRYVGRKTAASPATGYKKAHDHEHKRILQKAFRDANYTAESSK
jgi:2-oxoglutarate dehydrogenase E1 component